MALSVENWPNGLKLIQDDGQLKLTTDSVLLAHFASVSRCALACELGCGTGGLALLLANRAPKLSIDCIELQPEAADIARKNMELNGFDGRVRIIEGDLRSDISLTPDSYDLAVCNPPYFAKGTGRPASRDSIEAARADGSCTLGDVCAAAARLLKWGGRFAVVFRAERMVDLFCAMRENRLEPKRLRRIIDRHGKTPELILVEARRGGGVSLVHEPDLVMRETGGEYSEEVLKIYTNLSF